MEADTDSRQIRATAMRNIAAILLLSLAWVLQVNGCWYVDDNFVRKDCGIMPRQSMAQSSVQ